MSAPRFVGFVSLSIGLLSGLALVIQPFFVQAEFSPWVMGILFPVCTLFGLLLFATGEQRAKALGLSATALLFLGIAALLGLFLEGAGLVVAMRPTLALWLIAPATLVGGLLLNYFAGALERLGPAVR